MQRQEVQAFVDEVQQGHRDDERAMTCSAQLEARRP
jgi:hypothetical protein